VVAALHHRPLLPYQRAMADLLGEQEGGRYAYSVGVVLLPRQTGKTTSVFDLAMGRCAAHGDYRAAYTAQTGHVTTERFAERMAQLGSTTLGRRVQLRRSQGTERLTFRRGSFLKAFPPKAGALRGSTLDLVVVDEAQEITAELGVTLDQEIMPTQATRPRRQVILIGTAGTDASGYLARHLAAARAAAPGYCLLEYGATDEDDPGDPATWWRVHPGLAAGLTDEGALSTALAVMGVASFSREYLNIWQTTSDRVIGAVPWAAIRHRDGTPRADTVPVFGADVAVDRSAAAIVACWPNTDGVPTWEVVDYRPGSDWVAGRLTELHTRHGAAAVLDGGTGPSLTVLDELAGADWVRALTPREYVTACAQALDAITDAAVQHRGDPALAAAAAGAGKRTTGDGWVWARRTAAADTCPLIAGTLALYGHAHRRPVVRPAVYAD
jgi:phage terminase large subunit-like protein